MEIELKPRAPPGDRPLPSDQFVDYYEFLMVSPTADRAMIEWAVRLMLTRYGKKNGEQADPDKYELVKEAYRTLADPKRRELYDSLRKDQVEPEPEPEPAPGPVASEDQALVPADAARKGQKVAAESIQVEHTATVADVRLQKRLREGVMSALYDIVVTRPRNPELGRAEIARAMGTRIDEIEFTMWFLREMGLMKTTNQGLYCITAKGVEWVEDGGVAHLTDRPKDAPEPRPASSETNGAPRPALAGPRRVI